MASSAERPRAAASQGGRRPVAATWTARGRGESPGRDEFGPDRRSYRMATYRSRSQAGAGYDSSCWPQPAAACLRRPAGRTGSIPSGRIESHAGTDVNR